MPRVRQLKCVGFSDGTVTGVCTKVNDYTAGKAVSPYPAGDVAERTLADQQYYFDGTNHCIVLFYLN